MWDVAGRATKTNHPSNGRRIAAPRVGQLIAIASIAAASSSLLPSVPASAHDGDTTVGPYGIVSTTQTFSPSGSSDDSYNGYRVYLSSPRHVDSGSRGECWNPGRQENENGRGANWRAANGVYVGDTYSPTSHSRNLHARGYRTYVSKNTKVADGFLHNRTESWNLGAHLHIVTHSNASSGCNSSASYLLTHYNQSNDQQLASDLRQQLDGWVPGSSQQWQRTDFAELSTNAPHGDAYVELQFHDNQTTQSWLYSSIYRAAWAYGAGVDVHMGYP